MSAKFVDETGFFFFAKKDRKWYTVWYSKKGKMCMYDLGDYTPQTADEQTAFAMLDNCPLSRLGAVHITVSAMVADAKAQRVLMIHHNIYHTWSLPGGHVDGDADLLSVCRREIAEETGLHDAYAVGGALSVDLLPVPEHSRHGNPVAAHTHCNVTFGFFAPEGCALTGKEDENSGVAWVDVQELDGRSGEAHMLPIYHRCLRRLQTRMKAMRGQLPAIAVPLVEWFGRHARVLPWREDASPYRVWVSEIMLQQTRVEAVKPYFERFLAAFPDVAHLAAASDDQLNKMWEGLGYYSRVRNMGRAARVIAEQYDGRFPAAYADVLALPGIGAYTAGAICSISYGQPTPAVDGNVLRVWARITESREDVLKQQTKNRVTDQLREVYPAGQCGAFTQSLMELGATVCVPNGAPKCDICPVAHVCRAFYNGTARGLPVKTPKKERRIEQRTVFVLLCGDRVAVRKRTEKGLLAGLWEFPNVLGEYSAETFNIPLHDWGVWAVDLKKSIGAKHIFTHVEWHMTGYFVECRNQPDAFVWVTKEEFARDIALPSAFRAFFDAWE